MKISVAGQALEFERPIETVAVVMMLGGVLMVPLAEGQPDIAARRALYNLMLISVISGMVTLGVKGPHPLAACRMVLAMLTGLILLSAAWFGAAELLLLLMLPAALALLLVDGREMRLVAGLHVLLLAGLAWRLPATFPPREALLAGCAILGQVGILTALLRQVSEFGAWSVKQWRQAQALNAETAENQEKLEKALQNLSNANQLLLQANKRADRLRSVAEKAERTKSMFVARVSHEFRTPLNMIIGLVELMVEAPQIYAIRMPPELEKDLEVVLRNCRHLANMIDDVLELTRAESGALTLHRALVSLPEIIEEASAVVSPLVSKKGLALSVRRPDPLPDVYCDRTRIRQVILNLVSNACRFTERGGIEIKIESAGDRLTISVSDTGPGITPEDAEQIFDPFCQGSSDSPAREKGGSGLGLTISKQFVELHGGQMWLKSQPGAGSTFFFTLPVHSEASYTPLPNRWIQPDWIWHEETFKSARLEDAQTQTHPRIVAIDAGGGLLAELERFGDTFDLVRYDSLSELEQQASPGQADLIWVNVPDAQAAVAETGELQRMFPGVPLMCSAFPQPFERQELAQNTLYLTKPVTLEKLQAALANFSSATRRVLMVDDDVDVQNLLQNMLRVCCPAIEVSLVSNGAEALAALEQGAFDLLMLDVVMPGMTGWEVLEGLRHSEKYADLPVLFVSAQDLHQRAPSSPLYLAACSDGFSILPLLNCSLLMANVFPEQAIRPDSAHR